MTDKSPVEFFQLLLPDDLLQVVVDQTNLFSMQYIDTTELSRFVESAGVGEETTHSCGAEEVPYHHYCDGIR